MRPRRQRRRGFTLIELMVVVAIIGMLAAVAALKYAGVIGDSMQRVVAADFDTLKKAIDLYYLKTRKYPQKLGDLVAANILEKTPNDPWHNPYLYTPPSGGKHWVLTSYGSDGVSGGTGDAEDLTTENIEEVLARR